ncbi:Fic family protein [Clostridium botulinum]|uniref:Fic family protein n=1 Tax=Clostridium botulinum TaxID=1491 RepID=UPI000596CAFE|nr:Fic family protein [Clostridium botulinum]KIL07486.1 Fic family protein [Clostridium botulinum]MBY6935360.1 Fic family protein [Clostridium botulinum]NFF82506.1 Fic family protein [Clostridium botulinum]NFL84170.1 Fic family protein [Clostridium botulinum]NFN12529.1 Fic family protein [Clostridium botulinum]
MYDRFLKVLKETTGINNSLNQILKYDFIYHSNKIEGSTFTIESLQMLMEKNIVTGTHTLDDVQETVNSFYTFNLVIESLNAPLSLSMIKEWHSSLMYRTRLYDLGLALINEYNSLENIKLEDTARFHLIFEQIHPFQDGNGRIGRFIFLKQLLENKLPLKYMDGESSEEYKKALANSISTNVDPLVNYLNKQKDFIEINRNMF